MNNFQIKSFQALVKREYWEHKGAMLITPVSIAGFFAVIMLLGAFSSNVTFQNNGYEVNLLDQLPRITEKFDEASREQQEKIVQLGLYVPMVLFGFVMLVISFFYALSSLYDERKDKSILFWKSLPISDVTTVMSKFVAISLLIPVLYLSVIVVFQLWTLLFGTVTAWFGGSSGVSIWAASNLFGVIFNSLMTLIVTSLWFSPIWGWLMFASSWAKKAPFIWGILPIFLLTLAEGYLFRTSYLAETVGKRIAEGFMVMSIDEKIMENGIHSTMSVNWMQTLGSTEFWIGLIVSAIFLTAAIYVRRYRDES